MNFHKLPRGFTLIELLVVIAIAAVLASFAAPSIVQFARRSAMQSLNNDFVSGLQRARLEAVNRNTCATICKSINPEASAPRCTPGASGAYDGDDWHMGWIVYLNPTCDRTVTAADPSDAGNIVTVRPPSDIRYTLVTSAGVKSITFGPQGNIPLSSAGRFSLQDSVDAGNAMNRSICVDIMGRARIITDGGAC
jgi:type IV fimbrial biogenesis protein FimT